MLSAISKILSEESGCPLFCSPSTNFWAAVINGFRRMSPRLVVRTVPKSVNMVYWVVI
jgi:hypothetical protein